VLFLGLTTAFCVVYLYYNMRLVAFAGGRSLGSEWSGLVSSVVSWFGRRGFGVVVGDSFGADFLVASACSRLGVPCLVVAPPRPWSRLSFVASGQVPAGVLVASALVPPSLPLSRRLSQRSRVVASFSSVGVVFGGGRGSLGVFARAVLSSGGRVLWFPCGVPLSTLSSFGLSVSRSVSFGGSVAYLLSL